MNRPHLVQPFQPSIHTEGETSLIFFDRELSHAINKLPKADDFRSQEEYGSRITRTVPTDAQRAVADAALATIPEPLLYARVDLLTTDAGPAVIELELIEPALYFRMDPGASGRFADALLKGSAS